MQCWKCSVGNKLKIKGMVMSLMSMKDRKMGTMMVSVGMKVRKMVR